MNIVKREKEPTAYKHEIVGVVCDNDNCKRKISYGDYYYDISIESYTGESTYYNNYQYCEDCALQLAPKLIKSNDLNCDLTLIRRKLYRGRYKDIDKDVEELLIRGHYDDVIVED